MNLAVQLVEAMAWPLAAVVIALVFRAEVRALLGRLSTLKYRDLQADFERKLDEAERKADTIPVSETAGGRVSFGRRSWEADAVGQLEHIAQTSPRAAVTEAWAELLSAVRDAAEALAVTTTGVGYPERLMDELLGRQAISEEAAQVFRDLRALRNRVVHAPGFAITLPQAMRYIGLAVSLAGELRAARRANGQQ